MLTDNRIAAVALTAIVFLPFGCERNGADHDGALNPKEDAMSTPDLVKPSGNMKLTSGDFKEGAPIPLKDTSYGPNLSPELSWTGAPPGTASFALVCSDPDARKVVGKEFLHWAVVDLPPDAKGLPEGIKKLPGAARQLRNDFGQEAYGGPRPPAGTGVHRYIFALYALKVPSLGVKSGATLDAIRNAIKKEALDQATLTGTYEKK